MEGNGEEPGVRRPAGWVVPPPAHRPPTAAPWAGLPPAPPPDPWASTVGPYAEPPGAERSFGCGATGFAVVGALLFLAGFLGPVGIVWALVSSPSPGPGHDQPPDDMGIGFAILGGIAWLVICWALGLLCLLGFGVAEAMSVRQRRRDGLDPARPRW